jgi:hypothetical protein
MTRWLQADYHDTFPLSHLMRKRYASLWMRIHSLPESKRYPENDQEREAIFQRYSSFGSALLGFSAPCLMIRSLFATEKPGDNFERSLSWSHLRKIQDAENDEVYWYSWVTDVIWQPDTFRTLLSNIAEDRDKHVIFVSKASDSIFAPYDGGADGFSFDLKLISRLKQEFQPWLPSRTDGL